MKRNIQRLVAILLSLALLCGLVGCAGNPKSAYELAVKNGYTGTELEWLASLAGEVGADGESAYELAVKNGYKGTEAEWLNSLIGESGKDGKDGAQGVKGDKGDTGAQGAKGEKGDTGAEGKSAYKIAVENGFQGSVEQWLESLVGADGAEGKSAYKLAVENGYRGTQAQWLESLKGEAGTDGASGKSAYELAVENGYRGTQTQWLTSLVGANGKSAYDLACESGFDGDLAAWLDSLVGEDGVDGTNGANGKSAYELAVENGFDGSVTQWLASLVGADGAKGDKGDKGDTGATGATGADGKSAYEIARENGYLGTKQEWLASLVGAAGEAGANGKSAYEIAVSKGYRGSEEEWLSTLAGKNGLSAYEIAVKNGFTGDEAAWLASLKGEKGDTGAQGIGIANAYVNEELHLIVVLTDGTEIDSGYVGLEVNNIHTVIFKDWDGTTLKVEQVESGKAATAPAAPSRDGYVFTGWSTSFEAITSDVLVVATYTAATEQPVIYVQSQTIAQGTNEVTIQVGVRNNPGIMGAELKLNVDDTVFGYKKVQKTGFPSLSLTPSGSGKTTSPYTFLLDAVDLTDADRRDGVLFTITLTVKDMDAVGIFDVTLSYEDGAIFDEYYNTPSVVMEKGTITIE